jgi:tRNA1(Val) A37 N6-methylase TrmN6
MSRITFTDVVNDKKLTPIELEKDLKTLHAYKAVENENKFCGNRILYHFQMENLLRTRVMGKKKTLPEVLEDEAEYKKLEQNVEKLGRTGTMANRFFEAFRFNQAVVFFKPSTAKFIYRHFGATHVLDPTAGWGGRMLGASTAGIAYTGIDTNTSLQGAYEGIMNLLQDNKMRMIWGDALGVNFERIDYDFVLTSPPYFSKKAVVEVYEHQHDWNEEAFYDGFLVPLIRKCLTHIKRQGKVCFNMNKEMYDTVAKKFRPCDVEYNLLQQKRLGKNKEEKIYIWNGM